MNLKIANIFLNILTILFMGLIMFFFFSFFSSAEESSGAKMLDEFCIYNGYEEGTLPVFNQRGYCEKTVNSTIYRREVIIFLNEPEDPLKRFKFLVYEKEKA